MQKQHTQSHTKPVAKDQSKTETANYDQPPTSGQLQDQLRQAEVNGRIHQPY